METAKDTLKIKCPLVMAHLPIYLAALKNVIQDAIQGVIQDPEFGICRNWHMALFARSGRKDIASEAYTIIAATGMYWPHSRNPGVFDAHPVPRPEALLGDLWQGRALALRLDLMHFTQGILEELIQEANSPCTPSP